MAWIGMAGVLWHERRLRQDVFGAIDRDIEHEIQRSFRRHLRTRT
jgi:hypothetical protein